MQNLTEIRCNCKECGQPMDIIFQVMPEHLASVEFNGKLGSALATCKTEGCEFKGITLEPKQHEALTEDQREAYRASNRDFTRRQSNTADHQYIETHKSASRMMG